MSKMATGGQIISSEEAFDYNCSPCSQQELSIEAKKFCIECGEYFCSACLSCHEKFSVTKGHTLIKCEAVSKEHVSTRFSTCERHTDKEEDMVCCDHVVVCCRVCIVKDHRLCQNLHYLPDFARNVKEDGTHVEINSALNERIAEIKTAHNNFMMQSLKLKTRKTTSLKRLEIFENSIVEFVKSLVNKVKKDIRNQYTPDICCSNEHVDKYNQLLSKLMLLSTDLSCETDDISECKKLLECKHTLKDNPVELPESVLADKLSIDKFKNETVEAIVDHLNDDQSFGCLKIVGSGMFDFPNLYVKEEDSPPSVLLADFYNNKIRVFDKDLVESEKIDVEGYIWGICEINKHEIAFTLPALQKVQFMSTGKSPNLGSSFPTNLHCRGIAYLNENIYVTGGGMKGEERGKVIAYDLNGKLLCKYDEDSAGKYFSIPRSIVVNNEGIYITDQENGIICLDLDGKRKWVCNSSKCKFPWGLCFTPNGNLLVSGHNSNNIVIVSKAGELIGELLNENDGIVKPKAISMDTLNGFIVISELKKSHLKMFYVSDFEI